MTRSIDRERGTLCEKAAARLLSERGWAILARNFRKPGCELDIVASKGTTLIAVEVKYRSSYEPSMLHELVSRRQLKLIQNGLTLYCGERNLRPDNTRVDLAFFRGQPGRHCMYIVDLANPGWNPIIRIDTSESPVN